MRPHLDLVGQQEADRLQALFACNQELEIFVRDGLVRLQSAHLCPRSLQERDNWPRAGTLRTRTVSAGLCIAREYHLQVFVRSLFCGPDEISR